MPSRTTPHNLAGPERNCGSTHSDHPALGVLPNAGSAAVLDDSAMRLSVNVPNFGELPALLGLDVMAREAENAGADGVWLADHVVLADGEMTGYPYAEDGVFPAPGTLPFYESLASSAFIAAATDHCRIGIGVLVLPQRNVLELAKVAATVDRLSGGRFVLGVGAGWNRLEMEALGYSFQTRGSRMDEMLGVLRDCRDGRPGALHGTETSLPAGVTVFPTAEQPGGVPLIVGGMADIALRRAATADGWMAVADADHLDIDGLRSCVDRVQQLRRAHGGHRFEMILKLTTELDRGLGDIPSALTHLTNLGLDEIVIDIPWHLGVDRACGVLSVCRDAVRAGT
jgi:probable F420-dependent oxidoreductase